MFNQKTFNSLCLALYVMTGGQHQHSHSGHCCASDDRETTPVNTIWPCLAVQAMNLGKERPRGSTGQRPVRKTRPTKWVFFSGPHFVLKPRSSIICCAVCTRWKCAGVARANSSVEVIRYQRINGSNLQPTGQIYQCVRHTIPWRYSESQHGEARQ